MFTMEPYRDPHLVILGAAALVRNQDSDEVGVHLEFDVRSEDGSVFEVVVNVTVRFKIESRGETEHEAELGKCIARLHDGSDSEFEVVDKVG